MIGTARWQRVLGYLIGLSILGVFVWMGGLRAVRMTFRPRLGFLLLSFLATVFLLATSSARWGYVINCMERRKVCSYYSYFLCFVSGRFFGEYVSHAGSDFLLRPGLLNRVGGVTLKRGIYAVLVEKILDSMLVSTVIVPGALYVLDILSGYSAFFIIVAFWAVLLCFLMRGGSVLLDVLRNVILWIHTSLNKLPLVNRLAKDEYLERLRNIDGLERLGKGRLLIILAMTFVRQLLLVCRACFLVAALGLSIPFPILFVGTAIAQSSMIFAFTPGALGVLEGGWYVVLARAGIPQVERAVFLIGQRTYWVIFVSLIFLSSCLAFGVRRLFSRGGLGRG